MTAEPTESPGKTFGDLTGEPWWYLSFTDPDIIVPPDEQRPGGRSWLGGCYVQGSTEARAITNSHVAGCNPGGQIMIVGPLVEEMMDEVPVENRWRLLNQEEVG